MRKLLFLVPFFLAACALPVTKVEQAGVDKSGNVVVLDNRPDLEKKTESLSVIIGSNGYGIGRYGDETLSPTMAQLLRRNAYERFGDKAPDMRITIYHMVVYVNMKSALTNAAVPGVIGGAAGIAIQQTASKSQVGIGAIVTSRDIFEASVAGDEYKRATYTAQENPSGEAVYVIYVDADINGKRTFVRTVSPFSHPPGKSSYALAATSTIDYFLTQYSTQ